MFRKLFFEHVFRLKFMKKKLCFTLAFVHLALIVLTISHLLNEKIYHKNESLEKALAFLCSVNYSVWRYGFFSPDVGKSNEIEIITVDAKGRQKRYSTLEGFDFYCKNADLAKRFYGYKVYNATDTTIQDICARSFATRMMNLNPEVCKVTYTIRSIRYPTMKGFCHKEPVQTTELYTTDFILKGY
jgi:hypothetical protein